MSAALTREQVIALAPDAASAKAGVALATPRKWSGTGRDTSGHLVWGLCQGSGSSPYQTRIDLGAQAFACTCPSRKFPCKHALGLLLLLTATPDQVPAADPPAWMQEWLSSRAQRAERKAAKQEAPAASADGVDREAQQQRADAREKKVASGMAELAMWLRDLIRAGLGAAHSRPPGFWDEMAARLVDAQAAGAARMVRRLGAIASGDRWPERMLVQLSRLHLLVEGQQRLGSLPPELQATVRARIGWTAVETELALVAAVSDRWIVVGQMLLDDGALRARRTWLLGATTGRVALLLHFAHGNAPFAEMLPPVGADLHAELAFHPGEVHRATIRARLDATVPAERGALAAEAIQLCIATSPFADALARDPWTEQVLLVVKDVVPGIHDGRWLVRDGDGTMVPVSERFRDPWTMLALSGGHPVTICGEWDGEYLHPLCIGVGDALVPLESSVNA